MHCIILCSSCTPSPQLNLMQNVKASSLLSTSYSNTNPALLSTVYWCLRFEKGIGWVYCWIGKRCPLPRRFRELFQMCIFLLDLLRSLLSQCHGRAGGDCPSTVVQCYLNRLKPSTKDTTVDDTYERFPADRKYLSDDHHLLL